MAVAPKTYSFTVDAITLVPITVQSDECFSVEIMEDNQAGTSDYVVRMPTAADSVVTRPAGSRTAIPASRRGRYLQGNIIGYTKTSSGSWTMVQIET